MVFPCTPCSLFFISDSNPASSAGQVLADTIVLSHSDHSFFKAVQHANLRIEAVLFLLHFKN